MLKIYFNEKPLFLCELPNTEAKTYLDNKNTIRLDAIDTPAIEKLIKGFGEPQTTAGVIIYDEKQAFEAIKKHFLLIQAAGGLVVNDAQELLLIYRRRKWDLPKGKLDEGEGLEKCALREVAEETGISQVEIRQPLAITYHTYHQDGNHILKESHWYLMQTGKEQVFTPQTDEDIEKCEWVPIKDLKPYLNNTHPSILDVIKEGTRIMKIDFKQ